MTVPYRRESLGRRLSIFGDIKVRALRSGSTDRDAYYKLSALDCDYSGIGIALQRVRQGALLHANRVHIR